MHYHQSVKSGCDVIEHDSVAFGKFFQLANWRRLEDVEDSKKYKTGEKSLPRERDGDEGDQLSGNFVDDDELGIFGGRGAGDAGRGGYADERDQDG